MIFNELVSIDTKFDGLPQVGIEIETIFTPNIHKARYVAETLVKAKLLGIDHVKKNYVFYNGDLTLEYTGLAAVNACVTFYMNSLYKDLHWKPAGIDRDVHTEYSLELALIPLSFDSWVKNRSAVQHMLSILKGLEYSVTPKTGMHFNLDFDFFGDTTDEVANTIEKFYIFCYDNPDFLTKLTDRPDLTSSLLADIRYMIGDPLNINKTSARNAFINDKISFIKKFKEDPTKETSLYNISFNKDGRRIVENRHFSSTLDFYDALAKLETLLFITEFCKVSDFNELTTSKYLDFTSDKIADRTSKSVWSDVRSRTIEINKSLLI